jgi:hypothetical protein
VHSLVVESESKSVNTNAAKSAAPVLPEWMPVPEWNDFIAFRKEHKKPLTPTSRKYILQRLDDLRLAGHDPAAVLKQSIRNSWPGLYPLSKDRLDPATRDARNLEALGFTRTERNLAAAGLARPGIPFVQSEFGPIKKRSPEDQAAIEKIGKEFLGKE